MRHIFPLPQNLITRIAAGEVIERPVYAVKELLDNAIDAGADEIKIFIEKSGLKKITVIDNGQGMSPQDLQEAWKPHTTSKLRSETDLLTIKTLGFRGEALASITAISNLVIKSKTKDDKIGAKIEIKNNTVTDFSPVGLPKGTEVSVYNLFGSVPGRKKFLKSERTEFRHIVSVISSYAIAYPAIRFALVHNNRVVFTLQKTTDRLSRIVLLFGKSLQDNLLPVSVSENGLTLEGFISKLSATPFLSQKHQLFINNRLITNNILSSAIRDAYSAIHARSLQPLAFLFLSLPFAMVDVNVHPRKEEVRFHANDSMYELVFQAIKNALQKQTETVTTHFLFTTNSESSLSLADDSLRPGLTDSFAAELLRKNILQNSSDIQTQPLRQIHRLYILGETKDSLQIFDQHAAHERILYENLLAEFKKRQKENKHYVLQTPEIVPLSYADKLFFEEQQPLFAQLGFEIALINKTSLLLKRVPMLFKDRNKKKLLIDLATRLHQEKKVQDVDTVSKRMIAYLACRAAVKAGDVLTEEQMQDIVRKLENTPNNLTCPHGRPTRVEIAIGKIHKLFRRR